MGLFGGIKALFGGGQGGSVSSAFTRAEVEKMNRDAQALTQPVKDSGSGGRLHGNLDPYALDVPVMSAVVISGGEPIDEMPSKPSPVFGGPAVQDLGLVR